jgi:hypothetical protein
LTELRLPAVDSRGQTVQGDFSVPAGGCPVQWLSIYLHAGSDETHGQAWIDSVSIRPAG